VTGENRIHITVGKRHNLIPFKGKDFLVTSGGCKNFHTGKALTDEIMELSRLAGVKIL